MQQFIPPSDLNFKQYKAKLIEFLRTYPQFTDYDFEGSNFSVLVDLLAYNTFNNAHYLNMVGSEAWVDSAQLRESLVSHSTDLNYLPRSRISATTTVNIEVIPNDSPTSITLPKFYKFKSTDPSGQTISFVTNQEYTTIRNSEGRYIFENIPVFEGLVSREFFVVGQTTTNPDGYVRYNQDFIIESPNIDISSIEVYVKDSESSPNTLEYKRAETLQGISGISAVYFLRGTRTNQYALEFGDGVFGLALSTGNVIEVVYRNTRGSAIQGNYVLSKTTDVGGYSNVVITTTSRVQGGFEREDVESIRFNAPRYFQTQQRAVTEFDYMTLIQQAFPQIQQVYVYGGEAISQYGKIIVVLKPYGTTGIVTDIIKNQIITYLKSKNIVPEPMIIDPQYFYLHVDTNVYYGVANNIDSNFQQLRTNIINAIVGLNNTLLSTFNTRIYQNAVTSVIQQSDSSIRGCDVQLSLIKRWTPAVNIDETLSINFANPVKRSLDGAYTNADDWGIISTTFTVFRNGALSSVLIQDDGVGNLHLFGVGNDGSKTKFGGVIGTIDYDSGQLVLKLNISDYDPYIEIKATMATKTIDISLESFAIVDAKDINLVTHAQ